MIVAVVLPCAVVAAALVLAGASMRVLREYERGVVFRLGRVTAPARAGARPPLPGIDRMVRVSLRTVTLKIPAQEIITRDNVRSRHRGRLLPRHRPDALGDRDRERLAATSQIAQTTLRSVLGKAELDALLAERERLNEHLQQIIDDQTEPWGVKVTTVEIKDVEIPERMQHAMARQAEAERERRAKIINAEGEFQAAARLDDAADVISRNPVTIQLRYLQTLIEVSGNQSSTIVFPLPIDVLQPLVAAAQGRRPAPRRARARAPRGGPRGRAGGARRRAGGPAGAGAGTAPGRAPRPGRGTRPREPRRRRRSCRSSAAAARSRRGRRRRPRSCRAAGPTRPGKTGWSTIRPSAARLRHTGSGNEKWAAWSPWRCPSSRRPTRNANSPRRPGPAFTPGQDVTSSVIT